MDIIFTIFINVLLIVTGGVTEISEDQNYTSYTQDKNYEYVMDNKQTFNMKLPKLIF